MAPTVNKEGFFLIARFAGSLRGARRRHSGEIYGLLFVGAASTMVVWQVRHWNVSKFFRSSRDRLACMAMPQSGQWRMTGAGAARRDGIRISWACGVM